MGSTPVSTQTYKIRIKQQFSLQTQPYTSNHKQIKDLDANEQGFLSGANFHGERNSSGVLVTSDKRLTYSLFILRKPRFPFNGERAFLE